VACVCWWRTILRVLVLFLAIHIGGGHIMKFFSKENLERSEDFEQRHVDICSCDWFRVLKV